MSWLAPLPQPAIPIYELQRRLGILLPEPRSSHSHRVHHIPRTWFQHMAIHHPRALAFKLPSSRKPRRRRFMKTSAGLLSRNCLDGRDVDERDMWHVKFNGNRYHRRGQLIFVTLVVPVVLVRIPHSLKPSSYVRIPVPVRVNAPFLRVFLSNLPPTAQRTQGFRVAIPLRPRR